MRTTSDRLARYAAAANSFRMPYWDWAQGEDAGPVPEFFITKKIDVIYPDGMKETIWNPLYAFYFHPINPDGFEKKVRITFT
jgi:tyrosinase